MSRNCYWCFDEIPEAGLAKVSNDSQIFCSDKCLEKYDKCGVVFGEQKSPPLGLMPRSIHDSHRVVDILHAMLRYTMFNKPIPHEWLSELHIKIVTEKG